MALETTDDTNTSAPHEDDSRKPTDPTDIKPPNWKFVFKNAIREFGDDGLSDVAAGLTYYTVLSIFPAVIALVSILSLFGQSGDLIRNLITELQQQGAIPVDALDVIMPAIENLLQTPAPGIGLVLGILIALWTASNYVKAFSRAMNTIYEVPEGRGFIKLNASLYALTAAIMLLVAIGLVLVTVSGPFAEALGDVIGLGGTALMVFGIVKWPLLALIVLLGVALLYWGTPNVRQPAFRWISVGALVAIIGGALASVLFGFYVANFGSYDKTYGTLAGVIIFLFWINIINTVLLFGAEVDAELERGRELQAGIKAEKEIQLPLRDDKAAIKKQEKAEEAVEEARAVRLSAGESSDAEGAAKASESGDQSSRTANTTPDANDTSDAEGARPEFGSTKYEPAQRKPVDHYPKKGTDVYDAQHGLDSAEGDPNA